MEIKQVLNKLRERKINISVKGNDLEIKSDTPDLDPELLEMIKCNKQNLMDYFRDNVRPSKLDPIPKTESESGDYILSSAQRRLWILSQFEEMNIAYNMSGNYIFKGWVDPVSLGRAVDDLVCRHEILRTVFIQNEEGEIRQVIHHPRDSKVKMNYLDLTACTANELNERIINESNKAFKLDVAPLLRLNLFKTDDSTWVFNYVMHHIISDAWSMGILIEELLFLYTSYIKGETEMLQPLKIQYKDYAYWEQRLLNQNYLLTSEKYWMDQFKDPVPILNLPTDKPKSVSSTFGGGQINFSIDKDTTAQIRFLCQEQRATLFMGLLAAVNILLYKYTEQNDIVIGSPIAGREHEDLENQIGFYVNTLALRSRFAKTDHYKTLLTHVRQLTLDAYVHQEYPFDELVNKLQLQREIGKNGLFNIMISLQDTKLELANKSYYLHNLEICPYDINSVISSKFDLTFYFREVGEGLSLILEYNTDIYEKGTIERMCAHFGNLLKSIVNFPLLPIEELSIIEKEEQVQLLQKFNDTAVFYTTTKTLVDLFEEQVAEKPECVALIYDEKKLTYKEVNEWANKLAGYLRENYQIKPDDVVGIELQRSEWMIISILGILKSGAAYTPIDPDYPKIRKDYIYADSKCKVILNEFELEKFKNVCNDYSSANEKQQILPSNLAYVIYTSGSTGHPKGVMIEHSAVINRIEWMWREYAFNRKDVILQKTTYTFDVSVWELLMPLCWGCKMILCQKDDVVSPERILSLIEQYQVTCIHFVPSMLMAFVNNLWDKAGTIQSIKSLKRVITSGEALPLQLVKIWYEKTDIVIHNLYGPTEAAIDVTHFKTSKTDKKICIGRPIANTEMYVLDEKTKLLPIGIAGELYIGGKGLARGYMNNPELTTKKFIENPFKKGDRIYKTGDLGRWLEDGNIEYLGRNDDQVKIRGHRIELTETEYVLQNYHSVKAAAVLPTLNEAGEKELTAYLECSDPVDLNQLRSYLTDHMPMYMIPSHYVQLNTIPLTANGKIDRKKLLETRGSDILPKTLYAPPTNTVEEQLIDIWSTILNVEKEIIGINHNFFELGGNSLLAMRVVAAIQRQFEVKIEITAVLMQPTIKKVSDEVNQLLWITHPSVPNTDAVDSIIF